MRLSSMTSTLVARAPPMSTLVFWLTSPPPRTAKPSTKPEPLTSALPPPAVGPVPGRIPFTFTSMARSVPPSKPVLTGPPSVVVPASGPAGAAARWPQARARPAQARARRGARFMAA